MKPFLTINETEIALYTEGDILRVSTEEFSTLGLIDAYNTFGKVIQRRLSHVRETASGDVAVRHDSANEGR